MRWSGVDLYTIYAYTLYKQCNPHYMSCYIVNRSAEMCNKHNIAIVSSKLHCFTMYTMLYTVHCTVYSVHSTVYSVQCTQYSVYCNLTLFSLALPWSVVGEMASIRVGVSVGYTLQLQLMQQSGTLNRQIRWAVG